MSNSLFYYQQGDVLIATVESIPEDAKRLNSNVLQEGEHTGHAHRLDDNEAFQIFETPAKKKYLRVVKPVGLLHEEHKRQVLQPGDYSISIVREFDHFEKMVRKVID
jgi:hypothetical protein